MNLSARTLAIIFALVCYFFPFIFNKKHWVFAYEQSNPRWLAFWQGVKASFAIWFTLLLLLIVIFFFSSLFWPEGGVMLFTFVVLILGVVALLYAGMAIGLFFSSFMLSAAPAVLPHAGRLTVVTYSAVFLTVFSLYLPKVFADALWDSEDGARSSVAIGTAYAYYVLTPLYSFYYAWNKKPLTIAMYVWYLMALLFFAFTFPHHAVTPIEHFVSTYFFAHVTCVVLLLSSIFFTEEEKNVRRLGAIIQEKAVDHDAGLGVNGLVVATAVGLMLVNHYFSLVPPFLLASIILLVGFWIDKIIAWGFHTRSIDEATSQNSFTM